MSTADRDRQMNEMILQGKGMQAFEEFYTDDVVMAENFESECVGKDANRTREHEFVAKVETFHGMKLVSSAVNGDLSFGEWDMEITFKGAPAATKFRQVSVRRWRGDHVAHERFYYKL